MANIIFNLPVKGFSEGLPLDKSDQLTTGHMNNVRSYGLDRKIKITQRPAVIKWSSTQIGDTEQPVVAICSVSTVV